MKIGKDLQDRKISLYTSLETAKLLKISKTTLYRRVKKRKISFYKVGGALRFKEADIEEYLEKRRFKPITR